MARRRGSRRRRSRRRRCRKAGPRRRRGGDRCRAWPASTCPRRPRERCAACCCFVVGAARRAARRRVAGGEVTAAGAAANPLGALVVEAIKPDRAPGMHRPEAGRLILEDQHLAGTRPAVGDQGGLARQPGHRHRARAVPGLGERARGRRVAVRTRRWPRHRRTRAPRRRRPRGRYGAGRAWCRSGRPPPQPARADARRDMLPDHQHPGVRPAQRLPADGDRAAAAARKPCSSSRSRPARPRPRPAPRRPAHAGQGRSSARHTRHARRPLTPDDRRAARPTPAMRPPGPRNPG